MSNYNSLKTTIDSNIKQNGRQEITGQILNSVLNEMVNILGTGYQFAGVATLDPATDPGTPDAKVFYIANGKGTYTNFGGINVTEDEVVVLYWDSSWHKESTGIASNEKLTELGQEVGSKTTSSFNVTGNSKAIYDFVEGETYIIKNTSSNSRRILIYYHTSGGNDVLVKGLNNEESFAFTVPSGISYINVYSETSAFSFDFSHLTGVLAVQAIAGQNISELFIKTEELGDMPYSDYSTESTGRSIYSPTQGKVYIIENTSTNTRTLQVYLHKDNSTDIFAGSCENGMRIAFEIPANISYIYVYSSTSGFSFRAYLPTKMYSDVALLKESDKKNTTNLANLNAQTQELGECSSANYSESGTSKSIWSLSTAKKYTILNTTSGKRIAIYVHTTSNTDVLIGGISEGEKITFDVDSSAQYINVYCASGNFTFTLYQSTKTYAETFVNAEINRLWEKYWRSIPNSKILILGDSFSIWANRWYGYMIEMLKGASVKTLAVASATIRDKYTDRTTYPYTSRPTEDNNTGNLNTLACQIEKLKRLMAGTDLDAGETQWYANPAEYPNIIIIEGGMNDGVDSPEVEATYYEQYQVLEENVKMKRTSESAMETGSVYAKTPIESVNRTCFAGAYRYLVEELNSIFPNAQIFFVTVANLGYGVTPICENRSKQAEQQRKCAGFCSASIIDWHKNAQINTIENYMQGDGTTENPYLYGEGSGQQSADTDDAMHPNERGAKKLGRVAALSIIKHQFVIGD